MAGEWMTERPRKEKDNAAYGLGEGESFAAGMMNGAKAR